MCEDIGPSFVLLLPGSLSASFKRWQALQLYLWDQLRETQIHGKATDLNCTEKTCFRITLLFLLCELEQALIRGWQKTTAWRESKSVDADIEHVHPSMLLGAKLYRKAKHQMCDSAVTFIMLDPLLLWYGKHLQTVFLLPFLN